MKILDQRTVGVYTLQWGDDGIFRIHIHNPETLEGLKESIRVIGEMVNYKKVPILQTFDMFALPEKDVRAFWATNNSCPYIIADGIVVDSLGLKILGNFYLKMENPERPTKIFTHQEALNWLKTFL